MRSVSEIPYKIREAAANLRAAARSIKYSLCIHNSAAHKKKKTKKKKEATSQHLN